MNMIELWVNKKRVALYDKVTEELYWLDGEPVDSTIRDDLLKLMKARRGIVFIPSVDGGFEVKEEVGAFDPTDPIEAWFVDIITALNKYPAPEGHVPGYQYLTYKAIKADLNKELEGYLYRVRSRVKGVK